MLGDVRARREGGRVRTGADDEALGDALEHRVQRSVRSPASAWQARGQSSMMVPHEPQVPQKCRKSVRPESVCSSAYCLTCSSPWTDTAHGGKDMMAEKLDGREEGREGQRARRRGDDEGGEAARAARERRRSEAHRLTLLLRQFVQSVERVRGQLERSWLVRKERERSHGRVGEAVLERKRDSAAVAAACGGRVRRHLEREESRKEGIAAEEELAQAKRQQRSVGARVRSRLRDGREPVQLRRRGHAAVRVASDRACE